MERVSSKNKNDFIRNLSLRNFNSLMTDSTLLSLHFVLPNAQNVQEKGQPLVVWTSANGLCITPVW